MKWNEYTDIEPEDKEKIIVTLYKPINVGIMQSSILLKYYGVYNKNNRTLSLLPNSPTKSDSGIIDIPESCKWAILKDYLETLKNIKLEKSAKNKKIKSLKQSKQRMEEACQRLSQLM